jgi:hypothetical protein
MGLVALLVCWSTFTLIAQLVLGVLALCDILPRDLTSQEIIQNAIGFYWSVYTSKRELHTDFSSGTTPHHSRSSRWLSLIASSSYSPSSHLDLSSERLLIRP